MTKSSKLIATLGVVAGLGVAALPLGSVFATTNPQTTTGEVQLYVEVQPAIAMTISGNNDSNSADVTGYAPVEVVVGTTDVSTFYELDSTTGEYSLTEDSVAQDGTTYYKQLATATDYHSLDNFSPDSGAGDDYSVDGHPEAHVGAFSSSYIDILPNAAKIGNRASGTTGDTGFGSTVTVYTNSATGYTLRLEDVDSDTNLHKIGATDVIPTNENTPTAGQSRWGYKVTASAASQATGDTAGTVETGKGTWSAMAANGAAASAAQIAHQDVKTIDGTEYIVDYGVSTSPDQATGTYQDTVIYTATTK